MTLQEKIAKRDALVAKRAEIQGAIKALSLDIAREEADAALESAVAAARAKHAQAIGAVGIASGEQMGKPG